MSEYPKRMTKRVITRTVIKPDLQTYLELSKDYSSTLTCPCEHVAIKYVLYSC